MATLSIRDLPDEVHAHLRARAARSRRSVEAEARAIVTAACLAEAPAAPTAPACALREWVDEPYAGPKPTNVVERLLAERRAEAVREATE